MQTWIWQPTERALENIYLLGFGTDRELPSEIVRLVSIPAVEAKNNSRRSFCTKESSDCP